MITVTGLLKDVFGAAALSGGLRVTLNGYGAQMPRVSGTGFIVDPDIPVNMPGDGTFSFTVFGNDVILPGPNITFYTIAFIPQSGGVVKCNNYQITGSGSFDLSTLSPIFLPTPSPLPPNPVITNPSGLQIISIFALQTRLILPPNTVASSATPIFDAQNGTSFRFTMNQNVSSSTLINTGDGEIVVFELIQNSTGGWTFAFPSNVVGGESPDPTPNVRTIQPFHRMGVNFYPLGPPAII